MYKECDFLKSFRKYDKYTEDKVALGIEQNRKGWGEITVLDAEGNPVSDAKITLSQKSHEFKYGCNLFMLDEFESEEKNRLYKEYIKGIANMVTLPFFWDANEPEEGKTRYAKDSEKLYRRPAIDLCMEFCEENGIEPREHGLAYAHFIPKWLNDASEREFKKHFEKRCKEISERYGDKINCIEVVNEIFWVRGRMFKYYKDPDFVRWCFKTAEKYFPYHELAINELGTVCSNEKVRRGYMEATRNAMKDGAKIDAIGLHYHMFYNEEEAQKYFYNPKNLWTTMDRYSVLGLPLQISEVSVPAYSEDEENEKLQAEILEKLCKIWFAHPNVEQIIYWNLVDGYAHGAQPGDMTKGENVHFAGLLRFDMTPKPAYYTFKNLFEKEWRTNTESNTNEEGFALFKGFYGEYEVTVEANGVVTNHTVYLGKNRMNRFKIKL